MNKKPHLDQAIIESAEDEFAKFGIDKANMNVIAANAGVTKRTLYKYYENKEKLYEAILNNLLVGLEDELDFPFDPKVDLKTQLNTLIETKINITSHPHTLKVAKIFLKGQIYNPQKDSLLNRQMQQSKEHLTAWLKKCKKHKLIKSDVRLEMVTEMIFALVDGQIVYPIVLGELEEIENKKEIQSYIVDCIYAILK